ncbi:uncharacterized protein LOC106672026 [Cimex lectularius]|uniref:Uncharacterized protein n=1 Tax=Cimex lectularius TaxID=79782 RepID=A0A8I6TH05_CIMLE|nr:uncharacterized protein LOC106672026 [Cimex lectularius]
MPACSAETVGTMWSPTPPTPSTPISCSPPPRLLRSTSSTFTLLDRRYLTPSPPPKPDLLPNIIGWYPTFVLRFARNLIATVIYLIWSQFLMMGPALWLSAWLWVFWKCVQIPLSFVKWIITWAITPSSEMNRKKRTVLISGGSSIQALHLARNFYAAGTRVVVVELEGLFGLAKFSTAVDKFYFVPKPSGDRAEQYKEALADIVLKERVSYYIPVCATSTAYYDALVKPYLERLGVTVFCPCLRDVCLLDDVIEMMRQCRLEGLRTPEHYPVYSREDVYRLYDEDKLRAGMFLMFSCGPSGVRDRMKVLLPQVKREFSAPHYISLQRPWVIVKDYPGDHYITCTTVKESRVVANVTCKLESSGGNMAPVENEEIDRWIDKILQSAKFEKTMSGHMSFRFVDSANGLVPLGCRVGVSLPYICHTSVHARLVWKPCRHFSRQASGPVISSSGRYWMHEAVIQTLKHPSVESVTDLLGTVMDKREALFAYWDPLPYCAYYHIQLPLTNVLRFLQGRRNTFHTF